MKDIFEQIYYENVWGNAESRSGDGSDHSGTESIRRAFSGLIESLEIKSIVDVPCGDFNWMQLVDLTGINYIGGDIVPDLVARNKRAYERPGVQFQILDATSTPIPKVDLIFCRDMLVHLSYGDISRALSNFLKSGSTYFLTTTFASRDSNLNAKTGDWRPLNLQRPPFSFPRPDRLIAEYCTEWNGYWADKCLGLWRFSEIETRIDRKIDDDGKNHD